MPPARGRWADRRAQVVTRGLIEGSILMPVPGAINDPAQAASAVIWRTFAWSRCGKPTAMINPNPSRPRSGPGRNGRLGRSVAGRVAAWLGWWILLMAFWVITDDSIAPDELLAGAGAAALAAVLVDLASHQATVTFSIRLAWLARAFGLPRQVLIETWIVFVALWRRVARGEEPRSGFMAEPVEYGPDTPPGRMRRALLVGAWSLAPNSFVLGLDRDRDVMVIHKLVVGDQDGRP